MDFWDRLVDLWFAFGGDVFDIACYSSRSSYSRADRSFYLLKQTQRGLVFESRGSQDSSQVCVLTSPSTPVHSLTRASRTPRQDASLADDTLSEQHGVSSRVNAVSRIRTQEALTLSGHHSDPHPHSPHSPWTERSSCFSDPRSQHARIRPRGLAHTPTSRSTQAEGLKRLLHRLRSRTAQRVVYSLPVPYSIHILIQWRIHRTTKETPSKTIPNSSDPSSK